MEVPLGGVEARDFAAWLRLREPADAAARAVRLLEPLYRQLAAPDCAQIHDLGTGTGSMGRWLAPRLSGAQHWIMHDRDPDLLDRAKAAMVDRSADGAPVTVETWQHDITTLTGGDFAGAALITASALLDMLTADEIERVVAACAAARCPTLLTLSVTGRVRLTPEDPLDAVVTGRLGARGGGVTFTPTEIRLGERTLDPGQQDLLSSQFTFQVPLPELPAGVRLERVDTRPGRVVLSGRAAGIGVAA